LNSLIGFWAPRGITGLPFSKGHCSDLVLNLLAGFWI
jgi:hypothetical protein